MRSKLAWTHNELEDLLRQLDVALEASGIGIWQHNLRKNGSSSICVEIGQFDWHHPRPEQVRSRPAIHCALDRLQSVDLAFCLTVAPRQVDGVTDGVDITAKYTGKTG